LLTSGSLHSQLHYHFIDVSSGREKYTYASRDLSSLGTLYNRFRRILLEKNICIIYEDSTSQWGAFITTKVLELEAKKSIPLSYRTHQDLLSILSKGVFKEEKFECDWTQENGFVKIQNDAFDHQDYQLKLSGNPNVRPTSFSPSPSLYVRFVNFMHSIRNKFTRLVIFHPVAYIVIILIFPLLCLLFLYAMLRNLKK